ncbi:putative (+)-neomenthol dehydrogenase [Helianthus anomalus]
MELKRVIEALVPLFQLSRSPRIVNVSSAYGDLHLKQELHDIKSLAEERTNEIFNGFLTTEEGAKPAVMAALLPDDGPSGVYFNRMEIAPFTL